MWLYFLQPEEDAVHFANRVKSDIARKGGLVDLDWYESYYFS